MTIPPAMVSTFPAEAITMYPSRPIFRTFGSMWRRSELTDDIEDH